MFFKKDGRLLFIAIFRKTLSLSRNIRSLKEGLMELGIGHFEDIVLPEPLFEPSSALDRRLEWIGRKYDAVNKIMGSLFFLSMWVMGPLFVLTILFNLRG